MICFSMGHGLYHAMNFPWPMDRTMAPHEDIPYRSIPDSLQNAKWFRQYTHQFRQYTHLNYHRQLFKIHADKTW